MQPSPRGQAGTLGGIVAQLLSTQCPDNSAMGSSSQHPLFTSTLNSDINLSSKKPSGIPPRLIPPQVVVEVLEGTHRAQAQGSRRSGRGAWARAGQHTLLALGFPPVTRNE